MLPYRREFGYRSFTTGPPSMYLDTMEEIYLGLIDLTDGDDSPSAFLRSL